MHSNGEIDNLDLKMYSFILRKNKKSRSLWRFALLSASVYLQSLKNKTKAETETEKSNSGYVSLMADVKYATPSAHNIERYMYCIKREI